MARHRLLDTVQCYHDNGVFEPCIRQPNVNDDEDDNNSIVLQEVEKDRGGRLRLRTDSIHDSDHDSDV